MGNINDNSDEYQDSKPQIKINKKMRMWNKYKMYCFVIAAVLAIVLAVALFVNLMSDSKNNNINKPAETKTKEYVAQLGNSGETKESTENVGNESSSQTETQKETEKETVKETQKETQAPTQSVVNAPQKVTFTAKDKFADAVFVGDTVINGIAFYKHLDASKVVSDVNMVSSQASGKVGTVMSSNPKKVFIMVGLNDANYGTYSIDTIVKNVEKFVKAVKDKNSSTEVYILSVLPVTKEFDEKSKVNQTFLNDLNYAFSNKASGMGAKYMDIATSFKDGSGYMFSQCSGTGCNLKQDYYGYFLNKIAELM